MIILLGILGVDQKFTKINACAKCEHLKITKFSGCT